MINRKPKTEPRAGGASRPPGMSRGLKKAVTALERFAHEQEKQRNASRSTPRNPNIGRRWGV